MINKNMAQVCDGPVKVRTSVFDCNIYKNA